jgi:hypothetical protein
MTKLEPKDIDGKIKRTGDGIAGQQIATYTGPGWASFHTGTLTIIGAVIAFAAFITYMIVDNLVYQFWGRGF